MTHAAHRWLSVHLAVAGTLWAEGGDRLLLDLVAPFARHATERGWVDRFFFLRYTAGGAHVRFRLHGLPATLAREVRPRLAAAAETLPGGAAWIPYEPEVLRYGGRQAVAIAERVFDASSRLVLDLLADLPPGDRDARLGRALLAMLIGLHVFAGSRSEAARISRQYGEAYLRQQMPDAASRERLRGAFERGLERQASALAGMVERVWGLLDDGAELPPAVAAYRTCLAEARDRLVELHHQGRLVHRGGHYRRWRDGVTSIFPSHLHMTNNRLGVTMGEECYLASLVTGVVAGHSAHGAPPRATPVERPIGGHP